MADRRPDLDTLYCVNEDGSRNTIYPADVRGRFQLRKRIIWTILFAVYLALPWIEMHGRPAVLIDIARRQFFLFGNTFNSQDFYLAFFVISGIGFTLIVVSAVYGRIWCGYACPQTVFLEGFYRAIERRIEGNRAQRKKLGEQPWTLEKIVKRGAKWLLFLALSGFLAHTLLSYFMPVEEVFSAIVNPPSAHPTAFAFVLILTALLTANFGWFREQLCIVVCPYGRLQGVLNDADTVNVSYDFKRGEPRGRLSRDGAVAADSGDCIDCNRCVMVCPTGIDIRNGAQLECIGCANCIDACDEVMDKVGRPRGLVRYDSLRGVDAGQRRFWRPRLALYAGLLLVGAVVFTVMASGRTPFEASLLRLAVPFVVDGDVVRNQFTLHLVNKQPDPVTYRIEPQVADGLRYVVAMPRVPLAPLADLRVPVFVDVDRKDFRPGLKARLDVRGEGREDLRRVIVKGLVGPRLVQ